MTTAQQVRSGEINRKTTETDISLKLGLDGTGYAAIKSGVGFLDHMLTLFTVHGSFDQKSACVPCIYWLSPVLGVVSCLDSKKTFG